MENSNKKGHTSSGESIQVGIQDKVQVASTLDGLMKLFDETWYKVAGGTRLALVQRDKLKILVSSAFNVGQKAKVEEVREWANKKRIDNRRRLPPFPRGYNDALNDLLDKLK